MSAEAAFLHNIFGSALRGTPKEEVWKWADQNVFFSEKMAAEASGYDSSMTPWAREWQDMIRDPDTHEGVFMKCSQSGVTEASLNVIRWMPKHLPGNVAYIINSDKKAKRISRVRLAETLRHCAGDHVSDDANDFSTYHIILDNMEVSVSGSGSPNPFRETWYRAAFLDEPEDHEELPDGTTYSAIKSRFTTVSDATLFVLGKPQFEGGVIHRGFCKGTQEIWMVPCPHCGERIELIWDFLRFGHCRDLAGGWDLDRVRKEVYYECQKCGKKIDESQKKAMVAEGIWIPRPLEERMKLDGRSIPAEPGIRSFHISDLYSSFPGVSWANLAQKYLSAYVIAPSQKDRDDFVSNHMGLPIKDRQFGLKDTAILNLRGGLIEEQDGRQVILGRKFGLCYEHGEEVGELPVRPDVITITGDRQKEMIKWLVFAWKDGAAYLIDYGHSLDETDFLTLRDRPYHFPGDDQAYYIFGGLIDCRYRPKKIYEMCLKAIATGWSLWPTRGSGWHSEFRGKNLREVTDYLDGGGEITLYEFFDHGIKSDFYLGKIGRREDPRLWLPDPVPQSIITEWTSEKLETKAEGARKVQKWIHDDTLGPNDYGDCAKMQYVLWQLIAPELMLAD